MKSILIGQKFSDFVDLKIEGCTRECSFDRKCLTHVDDEEIWLIRKYFWGKPEDDPYMPKKRLENIQSIFKTCEAIKANILSIRAYLCNNL